MIGVVLVLMAVQPLLTPIEGKADQGGRKSVPHTINYQGYLTTADNAPVSDTLNMVFALYRTQNGGNALWESPQMSVPVLNGVFNVILGENSEIPDSVFNGGDVWLEIRINGVPLTPRQKVVSVGYSYRSINADYAVNAGHAVNADTAGFALIADSLAGESTSPWRVQDSIIYPVSRYGLAKDESDTLWGDSAITHINLGHSSITGVGVSGINRRYSAVLSGLNNRSENDFSVVTGGYSNDDEEAYHSCHLCDSNNLSSSDELCLP